MGNSRKLTLGQKRRCKTHTVIRNVLNNLLFALESRTEKKRCCKGLGGLEVAPSELKPPSTTELGVRVVVGSSRRCLPPVAAGGSPEKETEQAGDSTAA